MTFPNGGARARAEPTARIPCRRACCSDRGLSPTGSASPRAWPSWADWSSWNSANRAETISSACTDRRAARGPVDGDFVDGRVPCPGDAGELGQGEDGSVVSRPGATADRGKLGPAVAAFSRRPCSPVRRADTGTDATEAPERGGCRIGGQSLIRTEPSGSLISWPEALEVAAHRHISANSWASGLGRLTSWPGSSPFGGRQEGGEPSMDLVVVGTSRPGRDPPPEDPPVGPALHILGVLDPLVEDRPERFDPDFVERIAAPGRSRSPPG